MGMLYAAGRQTVTPVAAAALLALLTNAVNEIAKVKLISVDGHASAAGINVMALYRDTANGTSSATQTAAKRAPGSPASYSVVETAWSVEPTEAANPPLWERGLQAFGGQVREYFGPNEELIFAGNTAGDNHGQLQSVTGTNIVTLHVDYEDV